MNRATLQNKLNAQNEVIRRTIEQMKNIEERFGINGSKDANANTMYHQLARNLKRQQAAAELTTWAIDNLTGATTDPAQINLEAGPAKTDKPKR